jgi:hypothetical protein
MSNGTRNPKTGLIAADDDLIAAALSYSDNTPEEEQRDLKAFMDAVQVDLEASLPPYDWS